MMGDVQARPAPSGTVKPAATSHWAPWTDKKGRFDPVRAVVFVILLLPALSVAVRYPLGMMGARPLNAAIHSTGYWAVVCLVASLVVSPARAIFANPGLVRLRRMIGNAALCYAALHLLLYCADENWKPLVIIGEIVKRFYLTIGFAALLGMIVLGATSTDGAIRRMGARWKRLHKWVYGIAVLALFHFVLQTKADVSVPLLFVGIFVWLMIWRAMPAGRDRSVGGLAAAALAAALATLVLEWLWYRFGTHIDPFKVIAAEADISFGLGPADKVLATGILVIAALELHRLGQGPAGEQPTFWIVLFASGAAVYELIVFAFGIDRFLEPGDLTFLWTDLAWALLLGALGYVHWRLRERPIVAAVDLLAVGCIGFQITLAATSAQPASAAFAAAIACTWALLAWQAWRDTKIAALGLVPLALVMAYGVATQM